MCQWDMLEVRMENLGLKEEERDTAVRPKWRTTLLNGKQPCFQQMSKAQQTHRALQDGGGRDRNRFFLAWQCAPTDKILQG